MPSYTTSRLNALSALLALFITITSANVLPIARQAPALPVDLPVNPMGSLPVPRDILPGGNSPLSNNIAHYEVYHSRRVTDDAISLMTPEGEQRLIHQHHARQPQTGQELSEQDPDAAFDKFDSTNVGFYGEDYQDEQDDDTADADDGGALSSDSGGELDGSPDLDNGERLNSPDADAEDDDDDLEELPRPNSGTWDSKINRSHADTGKDCETNQNYSFDSVHGRAVNDNALNTNTAGFGLGTHHYDDKSAPGALDGLRPRASGPLRMSFGDQTKGLPTSEVNVSRREVVDKALRLGGQDTGVNYHRYQEAK